MISLYDSLRVNYNNFLFPTRMYKLGDKYYLYISDYTYSNLNIDVKIENTGVSNPISTELPFEEEIENDPEDGPNNPGGGGEDLPDPPYIPDRPGGDDEPTRTDNVLTASTLRFNSGNINNMQLMIPGNITNYTLII